VKNDQIMMKFFCTESNGEKIFFGQNSNF